MTFTSDSPGTVTGRATMGLGFSGLTGTVTRTTDGTAANSGAAVKDFVDGSLTWHKVDQSGAPLGGAHFEVCRTHDYSSDTKVHTALAQPACFSVLDNSGQAGYTGPYTDATAGTLKAIALAMGTYSVRETAAPTGYSFDPALTRTATLETLPATARHGRITTAFVNTQLYKMIVLTCNQVTNELVGSSVTLDGTTRTTLTSDPDSARLCGLAGATYGDLARGTRTPEVVIPAP